MAASSTYRPPTARVERILARQHADNLIQFGPGRVFGAGGGVKKSSSTSSSRLGAGGGQAGGGAGAGGAGGIAAGGGHGQGTTLVYVRDEDYGWLPAQLIDVIYGDDPDTGEEGAGEAREASVVVRLPEDWVKCTQLMGGGNGSSVEELEEDLESAYGGISNISRAASAMSDTNSVSSVPSSVISTSRPGQARTVLLSDYPNSELPMQNVDRRGRVLGKSDMADLPFLHEAAILYNLKDRHARGVPYTRVGDIVVAMNPFRWIDGLYAGEKQAFYSEHLIWNAPDDEDKDDEDDDEDDDDYNDDGYGRGGRGRKPPRGGGAANENNNKKRKGKKSSSVVDKPTVQKSEYDRLGYEPHVYETACLAYRGLAVDQADQTILVSGESGAGKTETVKIVMGHLATVETTRPFAKFTTEKSGNALGADETVKRVLRSNPVFEAFGNARTVRNDNSSRFGRFTRLQFDVESTQSAKAAKRDVPACQLAGSTVETYLLEKSRVCGHGPGERTYHVFYHLLEAPEEEKADIWDELVGTTLESFAYVGFTDCHGIEGTTDAEGWVRTRDALALFGIHGPELRELMRALCVVLQLGNLRFGPDPESDHGESSVITSRDELDKLAELMGEPSPSIERAMTERLVKARGEEIRSYLTDNDAKDGCDALAKEIYARIFDVLVRRINEYTDAEKHYVSRKRGSIGPDGRSKLHVRQTFGLIALLDIFGFERFDVNRFEQLCINYANERLQQKYVLDNFRAVQEEYESEGIELFDFSMVDNSDILTLLEGKMGLIVSLNEECMRPKGNDESFVYKIKMVHGTAPQLLSNKLDRSTQFGIRHYAGPVSYDALAFVERNTDRLPPDLLDCACRCGNSLISDEFTTIAENLEKALHTSRGRKRSVQTVITKFKSQLTSLMSSIESTRARYIRCIKPNPLMEPGLTNHQTTLTQLVCAGLVTAIAISRESFPNKLTYDLMIERFRCLVPSMMENGDVRRRGSDTADADNENNGQNRQRSEVEHILMTLLHVDDMRDAPYACGKTKVYFRAGALERLETIRLEYFSARAILLQSWVRQTLCRSHYMTMRRGAVIIQALFRGYALRKRYMTKKRAVLVVQCFVRCTIARWELVYRREYWAATMIQKQWRIIKPRLNLLRHRYAAKAIQSFVRRRNTERARRVKLAVAVEEKQMDTKLSELKQQVSDEASIRTGPGPPSIQSVDEKLLEEIEMMFDYLRKEIYTLRGKNSDLRSEIRKLDQERRELVNHAQSVEAASELSKLRVAQLTKTNSALISEVMGHKQELSHLKKDLRRRDHHHEKELSGLRDEFDNIVSIREVEVKKLKKELKDMRQTHRMETDMLREEVDRIQDEHLTEVMRLKNELRKTQDSHHDYLAKLMDVLETTHAARETETARINEELSSVREEKDCEIERLKKEIHRLKRSAEASATSVSSKGSTSEREKKSTTAKAIKMRDELSRGQAARAQRSRKFRELSEELGNGIQYLQIAQQAAVGDNTPRSLLGRKSAKRGGGSSHAVTSARLEEEATKLKQTIQMMEELYWSEESSHTNIDMETLKAVDDVMMANRKSDSSSKYKEALRSARAENENLRRQLADQSCRACGYRSHTVKSSAKHSAGWG